MKVASQSPQEDLLHVLQDFVGDHDQASVQAVAIIGPNPFTVEYSRRVIAVHPDICDAAAVSLAESNDFGECWGKERGSFVVYKTLRRSAGGEPDWQSQWMDQGCNTAVRVAFPVPGGRHLEMYLFLARVLEHRAEAAEIAWLGMNLWPEIKAWMEDTVLGLTPREKQALVLAFQGKTVEESSKVMDLTPRTVTYHLSLAMEKLGVDRKLEAIQRACWLGII